MTGKKENSDIFDKEVTNDDDFVLVQRGGQVMSGGFHVNSLLLKYNQSPMYTLNATKYGGSTDSANVSDIFKDLAVPAGIFYQQPMKTGGSRVNKAENNIGEKEVDDDLYDKLVKLASVEKDKMREKNNRKSAKNIITKNNKQKFTKKIKVSK